MTDGECVDGVNGRCIWPYGGENVCQYDECFSDADCGGARACECRNEAVFGVNRCYAGNCRTDSDCGGGYCSPSAVHVFPNCMTDIAPGSVGFFCHTEDDECTDDADCGQDSAACIFSVDALHWVCHELLCTN